MDTLSLTRLKLSSSKAVLHGSSNSRKNCQLQYWFWPALNTARRFRQRSGDFQYLGRLLRRILRGPMNGHNPESPIIPLWPAFAGAPFSLAPERAEELKGLIAARNINFTLDDETHRSEERRVGKECRSR